MNVPKNIAYPGAVIIMILIGICALGLLFSPLHSLPEDSIKQPAFDPLLEKGDALNYKNLSKDLFTSKVTNKFIKRNIFSEKKEHVINALFSLKTVYRKEMPITFKGSIVRGDNVMIAQINWGNKTYFSKIDDTIKDWLITAISKEQVSILNTQTKKSSVLYLNKPSFYEKLEATIYCSEDDTTYTVKKGDTIRDYKVLDISDKNVLLSTKNSQINISLSEK